MPWLSDIVGRTWNLVESNKLHLIKCPETNVVNHALGCILKYVALIMLIPKCSVTAKFRRATKTKQSLVFDSQGIYIYILFMIA